MDMNHKIAIFRVVPSLMMMHQDSFGGVENQVSLDAKELVMCKACFEQWLYDQCVCKVMHYHGAYGIFSTEEFLVWL
jgi:hypothetical protein